MYNNNLPNYRQPICPIIVYDQSNPNTVKTAMDQMMYNFRVQQDNQRVLEGEVNRLNNILYYKDRVIENLQNRINKDIKPEVIKTHSVLENKENGILYYTSIKTVGDKKSGNVTEFARFVIHKVDIYNFDPMYDLSDYIVIKLITGEVISLYENDLKPKKIVEILLRQNVPIFLDKNPNVMGSLLLQYISEYTKERNVYYIPYTSGWNISNTDQFCYFLGENKEFDVQSPYFSNHFNTTGNNDPVPSILDTLQLYRDFFKDQTIRVVMLSSLLYSIVFSIFNYIYRMRINKVILIDSEDMDHNFVKRTADMFLSLFGNYQYSSFEERKKDFKMDILRTKDEPMIINGPVNLNDYNSLKSKLESIREYFIAHSAIEYNSHKYLSNCLLFCLGGEIWHKLESNEYLSININSENVYLNAIKSFDYNKKQWTDTMKAFIQYVEKNQDIFSVGFANIDSKILNNNEEAYKLMTASLFAFEMFLDSYGINLTEELELSTSYFDILLDFVTKESEDERSITMLFMDKLSELVEEGTINVQYDNRVYQGKEGPTIYAVKDEVWIRHSIVNKYIVPKMRTSLKTKDILKCLANRNILILGSVSNTYEVKRPIRGCNKSQDSFVVINRKFFDGYTGGEEKDKSNNFWGQDPYENERW